jgi:hypothetical protein
MRSRMAGDNACPFRYNFSTSGLGFNRFHKTDGDRAIGLSIRGSSFGWDEFADGDLMQLDEIAGVALS